ncbi:hypothetical protein MJO28_001202, partial [Puccinia striiformis f. sp. tritici]
ELEPNQAASDRPELVTRVFQLKPKSILDKLTEQHCLVLVKRGLPHAHLMLIMDPAQVPRTVDMVDSLICAELPDPILEPTLFQIITRCMLHGPCNQSKPAAKNAKSIQPSNYLCENAYPNYRCRLDGGQFIKNSHTFTNQHVVPYNKFLTSKYDCHINVEIPIGIAVVKYLFEYITKGMDRSAMNLRDQDETRRFVNGRYVGPSEGLFSFFYFEQTCNDMERLATVTDYVYYKQRLILYFNFPCPIVTRKANLTTLTEYFELNQADVVSLGMPAHKLFHQDIPDSFDKRWCRQQHESDAVGRIFYVSVNKGEHYFLRLLLLNRRGAISFVDLRTVDDHCTVDLPTLRDF